MIGLKLLEIKTFMEKLFKSTIFDDFDVSQIDVSTLTDFKISGTFNKHYYSTDELEILGDKQLIQWQEIKDLVFQIIKGHKPPSSFKIVLALSADRKSQFILNHQLDMGPEQVNGLFINLKFDQNGLICTTGTSLKIFTIDKTLEQLWDSSVQKFFKKHEILYE